MKNILLTSLYTVVSCQLEKNRCLGIVVTTVVEILWCRVEILVMDFIFFANFASP